MKELLSFAFLLLFIACQNQPYSEIKLDLPSRSQTTVASPSVETCGSEAEETFDVVKELEHSESPGFYYRAKSLQSESSDNKTELICIARVTTDSNETEVFEVTHDDSKVSVEAWDALTKKWQVTKDQVACEIVQSESPICQGPNFEAEEGKLFSSYFEFSPALYY